MEPLPDPFVALLRAVADDRVRDAAGARSRTHWLARQAEEEGTVAGVLADLAERSEPVVCTTRAGRRHAGTVHALGADFVALRTPGRGSVLVTLGAVAHVRTQPGTGAVAGDRAVRLERRLVDVLHELVAQRSDVVVATGTAEARGELRAVGRDVLTLRVAAPPSSCAAYVSLDAVDEVRL
jgi:hypothetical protein